MVRFVASSLDLSRLPSPTLIDIDYETLLAQRIASLTGRLTAVGIEYDVGGLETDPGAILQQEDCYRQTLDLAAINDASKAVMLPYAIGPDLDIIGSLFGVYRMDGEFDDRFRKRIALAPEAYASAGSAGGYIFHALSVSADVFDAAATCPAPGIAQVVITGANGAAASGDLVAAVQDRLSSDEIRPLTDQIVVRAASIPAYEMSVRLSIPDGPSPTVIKQLASDSLTQLAAQRYRVGAGVDLSAIVGAAYVPNVQRITVLAPTADMAASPLIAPFCTAVTVTHEIIGG
jgi:phage-related baseplate assembly protein